VVHRADDDDFVFVGLYLPLALLDCTLLYYWWNTSENWSILWSLLCVSLILSVAAAAAATTTTTTTTGI
jgi:hypothetical protein